MSQATTASPKPSFRAPWRMGDAVVGRKNVGWPSKSGHPYQRQSKGLLQKRLAENLCWIVPHDPPLTQSVKGLNWTELNWTSHPNKNDSLKDHPSLETLFAEIFLGGVRMGVGVGVGLMGLEWRFPLQVRQLWRSPTQKSSLHSAVMWMVNCGLCVCSLSAEHDVNAGCDDNDQYIMTTSLRVPVTSSSTSNPWLFSSCSVASFQSYLDGWVKLSFSIGSIQFYSRKLFIAETLSIFSGGGGGGGWGGSGVGWGGGGHILLKSVRSQTDPLCMFWSFFFFFSSSKLAAYFS